MNLKVALLAHHREEDTAIQQVIKCIRAIEENYNHFFTINSLTTELRNGGVLLDEATVNACKNSDAILSSFPVSRNGYHISKEGIKSTIFETFDFYASVVPTLPFPNQVNFEEYASNKNVDIVVFSALKAGKYASIEMATKSGVDSFHSNLQSVHQLFHLAFKTAKNRKQKLYIAIPEGPYKKSIWEKTVAEIAPSYPMVETFMCDISIIIQTILKTPESLDCIFTDRAHGKIINSLNNNLFGLSNLLPCGHMGIGINLFEPLEDSQSTLKEKVNPIPLIYSLALLLSRFGLQEEAGAIQMAVNSAGERGMYTTLDTLPKDINCDQLGDYLAAAIIDSEDIGVVNDENIDLGKSTII
jgi:3-isopropylmalate dehydrogenase